MAARAVLVPGSGMSDSGRVAQNGFNQLADTMLKIGDAKSKRELQALEGLGEIARTDTQRDVLQNTNKSLEFDKEVNSEYEKFNNQYKLAKTQLQQQGLTDSQTVIEEHMNATNGLADTVRNPDGSIKANPKVAEKDSTRDDLLKNLALDHETKLQELNKRTIAEYERGGFNQVTDATAYSNRVQSNAIEQGLSLEDAEMMRKSSFEANKEADITDRDKARMVLNDNAYASEVQQAKNAAVKRTRTKGNAGTAATAGAGTKAQVKQLVAATKPMTDKEKSAGVDALNKQLDELDLNPMVWKGDAKRVDIDNIRSASKLNPMYNDFMLKNAIDSRIQNRGATFTDKTINKEDIKVIKADIDTQLSHKNAQKSQLDAYYKTTGGATGRKDLTADTGIYNAKEVNEAIAKASAKRDNANRGILGKGKETAAEQRARVYGGRDTLDSSKYTLANTADAKPTTDTDTKTKVTKSDRDILTGKKEDSYISNLTTKQLQDPKMVDSKNPKVIAELKKRNATKTKTTEVEKTTNDDSKYFTKAELKDMDELGKSGEPDAPRDVIDPTEKEYETKEFKGLSKEAQDAIKARDNAELKVNDREVSNAEAKEVSSKLVKELDTLDYGDKATVAQAKAYNKKKREVFSSWGSRLKTYGRNILKAFDQKDEASKQRLRNKVRAGNNVAVATQNEIDAYIKNRDK